MVLIRKQDVPLYLRGGSLFIAFDDDEEGQFDIPAECLKSDHQVHSLEDLRYVLRSLRYWGVIVFPQDIYRYIFLSVSRPVIAELKMEFKEFECQLNGVYAMAVPDAPLGKKPTQFNIQTVLEYVNGPIDAAVKCDFGLKMVKWLHSQHYSITVAYARAATMDRHLDVLKYFVEDIGCEKDAYVTAAAILGGSLDCLNYLLDQGFPIPVGAVSNACYYRQPHILACLLQRGVAHDDKDTMYYAVRPGNIECVEVLGAAGFVFDFHAATYAAHVGNVECLELFRQRGIWSVADTQCAELCHSAAKNGQVCCLRYLHELGCPWDSTTADIVLRSYECLKYAHEHGCPWSGQRSNIGDMKCLAYVVLKGPFILWMSRFAVSAVLSLIVNFAFQTWLVNGEIFSSVWSVVLWALVHVATGWLLFVLYYYLRYFSKE